MAASKTGLLKGVILVGGPLKGTRFRPLSLERPKPLFPVGGFPAIQHHVEAFSRVPGLKEILVIGFYPPAELNPFLNEMQKECGVNMRYLQEFTALGTGGGIHHFRDQILTGDPEGIFVVNCDICGELPLEGMLQFQRTNAPNASCIIMTTEATREQSLNYGCVVVKQTNKQVVHYVEKPKTFISKQINCGVYLISPKMFHHLAAVFRERTQNGGAFQRDEGDQGESINFEFHIFPKLANTDEFYAFHSNNWWSQIKTAAAAIYANRHCLLLYREKKPDRLADRTENIIGDVYIHPSAKVHYTASIGPNVSIGKEAVIEAGVRIRESIILEGAVIQEHSCVLHSVIDRSCVVGSWSRIEGTPAGPNPNMPFAKMDSKSLFKRDGRLNPAITILGSHVQVPKETIILNSIVLPHKELTGSYKNQIIL